MSTGDFIALLGRTGAGKSTLLLSFNGLVPQATGGTIRGRVLVRGRDTRKTAPAALAGEIGMVFQDAESQLFQPTVEDEVAFGLENLGMPREEIARRITWALALVGMEDFRVRSPRRLSGGEMQRVAIAAALAVRPALLALDEPTAHLDPRGKAEVLATLERLRAELEAAIVMATQELDWAAQEAGRLAALHDGRVATWEAGQLSVEELRWLEGAGIGVPQVAELLLALSSANDPSCPLPLTLEGAVRRLSPARWPPGSLSPKEIVPSPTPKVITIEGLDFCYPNGLRALSGIDLEIGEGEYLALIGPNGAGKSTLARAIMGLVHPTAGRVLVKGGDTRYTPVPRLARSVGYAFQNPDHQIFASTVREELAFGPRNLGWPITEVARVVEEMLGRFRLEGLAERPPAVLGYGLRRKVAVAAVAAAHPEVLILDEPTGGLDKASAGELLDFLDELNRQGTAVILITHDMAIVAERTRRAIVLVEGRVAFDGSPRLLFARPDVLEAGSLLPPPITRLAEALGGPKECAPILTVEEFRRAWEGGGGR